MDGFTSRVLRGYEDAADFTDTDQLSRDAAEHGIDMNGFHAETLAQFAADVTDFVSIPEVDELLDALEPEQVGHDFWLTRNGHGAGSWDGDYEHEVGQALTRWAKSMGTAELYVGDDGWIYQS